jgi:hypothetical protein
MRSAARPHALANAQLIGASAHAYLSALHPGWSIDKLLLHPQKAVVLCRNVRADFDGPALKDDEILSALLNGRKRGWFVTKGLSRRRHRDRGAK